MFLSAGTASAIPPMTGTSATGFGGGGGVNPGISLPKVEGSSFDKKSCWLLAGLGLKEFPTAFNVSSAFFVIKSCNRTPTYFFGEVHVTYG